MDEPITLNLTLKELQQIDKYIEINDDTLSVLMKIKDAYPQPKMHLENEGEFGIVTYDSGVYYRLQLPTCASWYIKTIDDCGSVSLDLVEDKLTKEKLETLYLQSRTYCPDEPEYYDEVEWDEKDNPKPMNEVMDRLENKYKQAEDNQKPKTIRSIIDRWWMDTFTTHSFWDAEECMDDLADQIELWILRNKNDQR